MQSKLDWKVFALIGLAWFGYTHQSELGLNLPGPTPVINVEKPGSVTVNGNVVSLSNLVAPITTILRNGPKDSSRNRESDCTHLGDFWGAFADILLVDPPNSMDKVYLKTNDDVRRYNSEAGALCLGNEGLKGQYDGLAKAVDSTIMTVVPLQAKTLTSDDKSNLFKLFHALKYAAYAAR